jgi:hypothetical protein
MVAALGATHAAVADEEPAPTVHRFVGECEYSGYVTFRDPIVMLPGENSHSFRAEGECTGFFDGEPVRAERAQWSGSAEGLMSCLEGPATGAGDVRLHGETLRFEYLDTRVAAGSKFRFTGEAGGTLEGVGASDEDLTQAAGHCMGAGLKTAHVVARLSGSISG